MKEFEVIYKQHAVKMMAERGITKEQVEIALKRGNKFKQTDGILAKYSYFAIAYKVVRNKYIIKTVYVD
ncbi:MAG: DUF4258 domain-containing protein [Nanoarchaeota archaeon]|nr:DUF4258 domain-containing protein [Nanoarchaeota archaeon]MBU1623180.1 DUF4258 domain-containing protein [Nanoarchaeota archaeon]MBU1974567.1 DUF4258 domain-containing protein [Nanoarchaeota archaeon]